MATNIRTYQPGDEAAQAAIYNEAAAALPRFKPATEAEVARRCQARDFDPGTRFYAEAGGRVVGYAAFHANGRVSFPWCRPGHAAAAEPLFEKLLHAMKARGLTSAFAAYRGDWPAQRDFFLGHGFRPAREMISFVLDLAETPARTGGPPAAPTPLRPEEVPAVYALAPAALRVNAAAELEAHLFKNAYFPAEAVFALRPSANAAPSAVGLLVQAPTYADPKLLDAAMPCYRLGAFGTEGMQTKRVNGLFSFLAPPGDDADEMGLELLQHAATRLRQTGAATLAAQVPSDVPHLLHFYEQFFRRQGSFPVFERAL